MTTPVQLDHILDTAATVPGVRVRTTNGHGLIIELRSRVARARQSNPDAYKSLHFSSSKSPLEIYILNDALMPENEWKDDRPKGLTADDILKMVEIKDDNG